MKKDEIKPGMHFIEKSPQKWTNKLRKIEILSIISHFEHGKHPNNLHIRRNYTYIYYKTLEGQYYPEKSHTNKYPVFLDGFVGVLILSKFKKQYESMK